VAITLLAVLSWGLQQGSGRPSPAAATVAVVDVVAQDVPLRMTWVATLDGYVNARIQPQVTATSSSRATSEGSYVNKGDVLFEIDPRPFQAALDQAGGQKAQADAQLGRATLDVERDIPLAESRAIAAASSKMTSRPSSPRGGARLREGGREDRAAQPGVHQGTLAHRRNRRHRPGTAR